MSRRSYPPGHIDKVYEKSGGTCHYCPTSIARKRYGDRSSSRGWEIDHRVAVSNGGHPTHLNNLVAACWKCNAQKGAKNARTQLRRNGRTRGPLTQREKSNARGANVAGGAAVGATVGGLLAGPPGFVVGGILGAGTGASVPIKDPGVLPRTRCKATTASGRRCKNWAIHSNYGYCGVHRR